MMETLTGTPRSKEFTTRHLGRYDIITSTQIDTAKRVAGLIEIVKEGIPENWVNCVGWSSKSRSWHTLPDIMLDSSRSPRYVGKRRAHVSTEDIALARATPDEKWSEAGFNYDRTAINSFNSILSEFDLAPIITSILELPEAKEVVKKYDFDDIAYEGPLVGIIDRQTHTKELFYDYIPGEPLPFYTMSTVEKNELTDEKALGDNYLLKIAEYDRMAQDVAKLFASHGIHANDLSARQFIVQEEDGRKKLRLIDTEGYARGKLTDPATSSTTTSSPADEETQV